jgi:hypothetical protein
VRFALAVLVSAAAQVFVFLRLADWIGTGAILAVLYLALAALGAGWFAGHRSALAGALSIAAGVAMYASVTYFGVASTGMLPFDVALGIVGLLFAYLPFIAIGGLAGAVGGSLRRRLLAQR